MRLIDVDALKEEICKQYRHFSQRIAISPVFEAIKKAPTVDAVAVVRCKDCENFRTRTDGSVYCYNGMSIGNKNAYCSYAERRIDAD